MEKVNWEERERKKEYLKRYRASLRRQQQIQEELDSIRMDKMSPSVRIDDMPRAAGVVKDLSDYAARLSEIEEKLIKEKLEGVNCRRRIENAIVELSAETEEKANNQKIVLMDRYIFGRSWEKIASLRVYTVRRIHQIHAEALDNIKI